MNIKKTELEKIALDAFARVYGFCFGFCIVLPVPFFTLAYVFTHFAEKLMKKYKIECKLFHSTMGVAYKYMRFAWAKWIFACGFIFRINPVIVGKDKLENGACIVLCNHQSALETIIIGALFLDSTFVIRKEFESVLALKMIHPIFVTRDISGVRKMFEKIEKRLTAGLKVVIFPQATRVEVGKSEPYKLSILTMHPQKKFCLMATNAGVFYGRDIFSPKKSGSPIFEIIGYLPNYLNHHEAKKYVEETIEGAQKKLCENAFKPVEKGSNKSLTPSKPHKGDKGDGLKKGAKKHKPASADNSGNPVK